MWRSRSIRTTKASCCGGPNCGKTRRHLPPVWWSGGGAADGIRVYYPLEQPGGGLKALDIKSGKVEWNAAIEADRRGQAGPASAIPGAVFTGGWDGILRAVGADGKVIWSFNAVQDFSTVNGVPAKGGSFGSAGPVIVGGMLFAASGYPTQENGIEKVAIRLPQPIRAQLVESAKPTCIRWCACR